MEQIGALETVCRYPVKSMAGEELGEAFVGFAGLMGDRAYAFVRVPGPKGFPWHTQGSRMRDLRLSMIGGSKTVCPHRCSEERLLPNRRAPLPSGLGYRSDLVR